MACTTDYATDLDFKVLVRTAQNAAARFAGRHRHLDRDAVESEAYAAVLAAWPKWDRQRRVAAFGEAVVARALHRAKGRDALRADALRAFAPVDIDADTDADDGPQYRDAAADEAAVDDLVESLPVSDADRQLLRERLAGDYRHRHRDDGRTTSGVDKAIRRLRRAVLTRLGLDDPTPDGGEPCRS